MKIKTLFLDFDGVIAESVDIKTHAFEELYLPYGADVAAQAVAHHRSHGGMSRYEKFRLYHKQFLGLEISYEEVQALADQFSELVTEAVIASPLVPGVSEFLEKHKNDLSYHVITGTPTAEIRRIIRGKNLAHLLSSAFGSPEKKEFWVATIMHDAKLAADTCMFLGDAMADYTAAHLNGMAFALRMTADNTTLFQDHKDIIRFQDFNDFERQFAQL